MTEFPQNDLVSTDEDDGEGEVSPDVSFQTLAMRDLQRARKAVNRSKGVATPMSDYLISSATIYAILELADAMRKQ
jgi:hypothetical protein